MKTLGNQRLDYLNTIIYKVYTMEDFDEMRRTVRTVKTAGGF